MNYYDVMVSAIESVRRDMRPRGSTLSQPIPQEQEDTFAGLQALDLGPTSEDIATRPRNAGNRYG